MKKLLTEAQRDLDNIQHLQMYQKSPVFVKSVVLKIGEREIPLFCYYDLKREQNERNLFYLHLHNLKQMLESLRIPK